MQLPAKKEYSLLKGIKTEFFKNSMILFGKIEDFVEVQPLGEMQLKGFTRPVPTFNISKLK